MFGEIQANANHPDRERFSQDDGPRWLTMRAAEAVSARLQKSLGLSAEQAMAVVKNGRAPGSAQSPQPSASPPARKPAVPVPTVAEMIIANYIPQVPLGTAMENEKQRQARQEQAESVAMGKIETLGLYAVVLTGSLTDVYTTRDNNQWILERGEAFPFLGYEYSGARVRLGTTWMRIPEGSITIVRNADLPEAAETYKLLLAEYKRDQIASQQQAALERGNRILSDIQATQRRTIQQQWLINQQILGTLQQQQMELQRRR